MDIELQLRENLVLTDPGTPFTDGVMSRVGDAVCGSGVGIVWLADVRLSRRSRRMLLGVLLVAGAAAAMLALMQGKGEEPVVQVVTGPGPAAIPEVSTVPAAAIPAGQPAIEPPVPEPLPVESAPSAGAFTVRVRPLANPDNVAGVDIAQAFRDRIIVKLQAIPNLVLVDPADGGSTDYEVRLRLENQPAAVQEVLGELAAAMRFVQVDAGPPSFFAAGDARLAAEAGMSPADLQRSQRARQMANVRRRTAGLLRNGLPMSVPLIDQSVVPSPSGADPVERHAQEVVRKLRYDIFPVDAATRQAALDTLRNPALPFNQRLTAQSDLLRIERRDEYAGMDAEVIRASADLALSQPEEITTTVVWENVLETRHPELIPQIARALDIVPDTNLSLRLIRFLASDFAGDPAARKVLEVAARGNAEPIVRMAALREVQGDAAWHAFVTASIMDTTLPEMQRLQPLADMTDPGTTAETARLALDDATLRELISLADKVVGVPGNSTQGMMAILALKSVDNPALADRLVEIVRAPVNEQTLLTTLNSVNLKMAAIGVASVRFPDDPRFRALLEELSASPDALTSAWAKDQLEQMEAMANPESRKAYFEKLMEQIMPQ